MPILEKDSYSMFQRGLNASFDNPLDSHSEIVLVRLENVAIVF